MANELLDRLKAGHRVMLMTNNLRIVAYRQVKENRVRVEEPQPHYEKSYEPIPYCYEYVRHWLAPRRNLMDLSDYEKQILDVIGCSKYIKVENCIVEDIS